MQMSYSNLTFLSLISSIMLTGCGQGIGFNAFKVDDLVKNPRVHEGEVISVVGTLKQTEDVFRLVGVQARLEGSSADNNVYLINYAAKISFDSKAVVKGEFATLNLPLLGTYLVIDAKSVELCGNYC